MTAIAANLANANGDVTTRSRRFQSIDQIRGAIMILMALDHVRWFFTNISTYQPETLADTNIWLFLTRWVTHYCAPGFFLLAGLGIFLFGAKIKDDRQLIKYLVSRGALLVALELTIVGYSWVFTPGYSFGGVIWSLGWSFIVMAALVRLPRVALLAAAAAILLLHNAFFDGAGVAPGGWAHFFWRALYQPGVTAIPGAGANYFFLFPVIPWLAMMVLGYVLGDLYLRGSDQRRRVFVGLGVSMLATFALLRLFGSFGNPDTLWISASTPALFSVQPEVLRTIISFLNVEKYPPSLQFTLMTLGPILLWLGVSKLDIRERAPNKFSQAMVLFGRVPLFYYICHLYVIHLLALTVTTLVGQPNAWIGFGAEPGASRPAGYGFELWFVHAIWLAILFILYGLCRWYEKYKRVHSHAWLKYL